MRIIDADLFIKEQTALYCEKCERRMGMKNGKKKFVYKIGDAPCRACEVMDMLDDVENAPTVEPTFKPIAEVKFVGDVQELVDKAKAEVLGNIERPQGETNADLFKQTFGLYATELWAMSESQFLKWLNSEYNYKAIDNASEPIKGLIAKYEKSIECIEESMNDLDDEGGAVYGNLCALKEIYEGVIADLRGVEE